jgi:trimeric autotransporter adhesin
MVWTGLCGVGGRRRGLVGLWGWVVGLVLGVVLVVCAAPKGVAGWHTAHVVNRGSGSVTSIDAATRTARAVTPRDDAGAALPAAAEAPVSAIVGRGDQAYRAVPSGHGYVLRNGSQRLGGFFGTSGAVFSSGTAWLGMTLTSYGYGDRLRAVAGTRPRADANRVVYRHRGLVQWYANGPLGIDQGFTLAEPPVGGARGGVTLSLALSGDMRGTSSRSGVVFAGRGVSLAYGGLVATDARGRRLPASMRVRAGRLVLNVDDRGARYPVRVDPLIQQAKLTGSDAVSGGFFGSSVAVSADGSTIVVGATVDGGSGGGFGTVYLFSRPPAGWASEQEAGELTVSNFANQLGESVAVSADGSTVVASANTNDPATVEGAVYVWLRPPGGWHSEQQSAELLPSDGGTGDQVGKSLAISGDTVFAGAVGANAGTGAVYVFERPSGGWADEHEEAVLTASDGAPGDDLGQSVATSGSTVVAGTLGSSHSGKAYVFTEPAAGWASENQTAILTASDAVANDAFGVSVAESADGSTVVVGAPFSGFAYVFSEPAGGWASEHETAELTPLSGASDIGFGDSVAVSGDGSTVVGGAPFDSVGPNQQAGAVYVFARPPGGWASEHTAVRLTAADATQNDALGFSVAVSRGAIVAGAPNNMQADPGEVYVFGPGPTSTSVGCSPSRVVVGQPTSCTATVTDTAAAPTTPTGTVTFVGHGSCALSGSGSSAACSVSFTPNATGTEAIAASYGGDVEHAASAGSASEPVSKATTATSVTSSKNPSAVGRRITFTASIAAAVSGAGTPTGTVTFFSGSRRIGTSNVVSGRATATNSKLSVGRHRITASYSGDQIFAASDGSLSGTPQRITAPASRFAVSDIKLGRDGTASFKVKVPGPGRIDVLETVWNDNVARAAVLLRPATRRFVYARALKHARRASTLVIRVNPNRRGRRLVHHHRYRVTLRLWVRFTPTGGKHRKQGFYGLHLLHLRK